MAKKDNIRSLKIGKIGMDVPVKYLKEAQETTKLVAEKKQEGIVIVVKKNKKGKEASMMSIAHEFSHRDIHNLIDVLMNIIHPEISEFAKVLRGLSYKKDKK